MSESKITLKDKNGKKTVFNVLFEVNSDDFTYVVYTNNKKDKDGSLIVYFAKYEVNKNELKNINKKEEEKLKLILNKFRGKDE